jgi:23S rRNA (guanine2445-N2)-methyltransferase / 23S rRNA (guanine2069-N7)-methyltransferase
VNKLYYATCPAHFEDVLVQELVALQASNITPAVSGVFFEGGEALLYRASLWLRCASCVRLVLGEATIDDKDDLYNYTISLPWFDYFKSEQTFICSVTASGNNCAPENYLMLVMKDAIVDSFRKIGRKRPNITEKQVDVYPDLHVHLHIHNHEITISLELATELFKRGYREALQEKIANGALIKQRKRHLAPLRENLAAGLLYRAGWAVRVEQPDPLLLDPMCGTGTFLIEGYMMAYNRAPNLYRERFGFETWTGFNAILFAKERGEAQELYEKTLAERAVTIVGYDHDSDAIGQTRASLIKLGIEKDIRVNKADIFSLTQYSERPGLLLSNPPYGQRMSTRDEVNQLFLKMGKHFKAHFKNWEIALLAPDADILRCLDVRAQRINAFYNGPNKCVLLRFEIEDRSAPEFALSSLGEQLKNRLTKRFAEMRELAGNQWHTNAFRFYDADLPEYNATCDWYAGCLVVQDYLASRNMDSTEAKQRFNELLRVLHIVTDVSKADLFVKVRRRYKPEDQYEKLDDVEIVERDIYEDNSQYRVHLSTHLDTGLYLDHRPLRRLVREQAMGKAVLNLFAYTGSMSVAAALGGATSVVTVDASASYLARAKENFELNGLDIKCGAYKFFRRDVIDFLETEQHEFDIIYIDPPTFSNSKSRASFDVQRDHFDLIEIAYSLLTPTGLIYFSTHFSRFKLDEELSDYCDVEELTDSLVDEDFRRRPGHRLWVIKAKPVDEAMQKLNEADDISAIMQGEDDEDYDDEDEIISMMFDNDDSDGEELDDDELDEEEADKS